MIGKLTVQISETADGKSTYMQISSPAAMPVNIVLIADEVIIDDKRTNPKRGKK